MNKFLLFLACLLLAAPAYAQDKEVVEVTPVVAQTGVQDFVLEKPHTQILFFADHLGFSHSSGRFSDFDGRFTLDYDDLSRSHVDVTIKTASVDMGDAAWNAHLKNADFLNVESFPEMHFVSHRVELVDDQSARVHGVLTLLGIEKPLTLTVTHNKSGTHPFSGKYVAGFTVEGAVRRSDYGMTFGLPLLGDMVALKIQVEGVFPDSAPDEEVDSDE